MKNLMINTRVLAIAIVASFTVALATPALANDEKKPIPVELRFVGNLQEQPLFHMVFTNQEVTEYTITVRDSYNNVLYKDVVKGGNITKKFLLNTDELGGVALTFEVTSKSYEKPVVFEINRYSRFVEDVVVNKTK
jgi:hypothetical protein